jgi:hypothetical protein
MFVKKYTEFNQCRTSHLTSSTFPIYGKRTKQINFRAQKLTSLFTDPISLVQTFG